MKEVKYFEGSNGIVIAFILFFAGYISLSINYSKAYNVKNELLKIIKNQGGICVDGVDLACDNFEDQIQDYFQNANYRSSGKCDDGWYGFASDGTPLASGADNAAFCVTAVKSENSTELPNAVYYKVKVFYSLGLPILELVFDFSISGETANIYRPNECRFSISPVVYSWC